MVWIGYPPKTYRGFLVPKQDKYQEICIDFYIKKSDNFKKRNFFPFLRVLAASLKESYDTGCSMGRIANMKKHIL